MNIVPIPFDTPSQDFNCNLGGQFVTLGLRTRIGGLYVDVYVNNILIVGGVICQNLNPIIRNSYLGFSGDLLWSDQHGTSDPTSPGLGSRYLLFYVTPDDIAAAVA